LDPEPISLANFFNVSESYSVAITIVSIIILLFISALISGSKAAFSVLSKNEMSKSFESKSKKTKIVAALLENHQKLMATMLIANNFINILIVLIFAFSTEYLLVNITPPALKFLILVVLITILILVFGEVLPKVYGTRNALKMATFMAFPLKILNALLSFASTPLMGLTSVIESGLSKKQSNLSVENLSRALELTSADDKSKEEHKILKGIVTFGNTETAQIMTPRIDIVALSSDDVFTDVIDTIISKGYSRIPVYSETIDEIIGVLYAKDLLPHLNKKDFNWQSLMREPFFVPENKKLDDLLKEFQEKKNHLAVVVDEYGGTSGIVSLEDVIEEIVGDINDEFDDDDAFYSKINSNTYIFEGKTNLKDFYKILDIENTIVFDENKGESETIAGFILEICGKFPRKNETINFDNYVFKIEAVDQKRIKQIKVTIL
jgi:gliding motility-associated protein GldE